MLIPVIHFLKLFPLEQIVVELFISSTSSFTIVTLFVASLRGFLKTFFLSHFVLVIIQGEFVSFFINFSLFKFLHHINFFIAILIKVVLSFTLYNLALPGWKFFLEDLVVESFLRWDRIEVRDFEFFLHVLLTSSHSSSMTCSSKFLFYYVECLFNKVS